MFIYYIERIRSVIYEQIVRGYDMLIIESIHRNDILRNLSFWSKVQYGPILEPYGVIPWSYKVIVQLNYIAYNVLCFKIY